MRNLILGTFSVFLSFMAAGAQNQPSPGNYYIVNSVLSPEGNKLAATFQDGQSNVFVTPLDKSDIQQWAITLGEQFILPVTKQTVAATAQNKAVVILPKNSFVWTIKSIPNTSQNYTIADQSQFWDLNKAADKENIVLAAETSSLTQSWVLEPVK